MLIGSHKNVVHRKFISIFFSRNQLDHARASLDQSYENETRLRQEADNCKREMVKLQVKIIYLKRIMTKWAGLRKSWAHGVKHNYAQRWAENAVTFYETQLPPKLREKWFLNQSWAQKKFMGSLKWSVRAQCRV
jgi:hypothetical protein